LRHKLVLTISRHFNIITLRAATILDRKPAICSFTQPPSWVWANPISHLF
jgi:hypothetical protein